MMVPVVAAIALVVAVAVLVLIIGPVGPTPRAAGVVAVLGLSALVLPPIVAVVGACALFGLAIVDGIAGRPRDGVHMQPPRLLARAVPASLRADLTVPRGATARLRQARVPDVDITPASAANPLRASITARRRGSHTLPGTAAHVRGPLGLTSWRARSAPDTVLTVYPDLPAARRIAAAVRNDRVVSMGMRIRGPVGIGTEFDAIREYQPDDDIRQVNWRATQRVGRPMSNRYRVEQDRDIICLVDCGRVMGAPIGTEVGVRTRLDAALDAVCAMAMMADAVGDRVGVVAFDEDVRRELRPHRSGSRGVAHAVHDLEPSTLDANYEMACRIVATHKRALVMIFTDLLDEAAARGLLTGLPALAAKHAVIIATVTDGDTAQIVQTAPRSTEGAYRVAAATDVLETRRRVEALLKQRGATVIDAPLEQFSAACVRSYLQAKQRARL